VLDGAIFAITNTSGTAIASAVLTANDDSYVIGTINAGNTTLIEPGGSNDGHSGHTFFFVTGGILNTSDSGPSSDSTPFSFTGTLGLVPISVTFTPGVAPDPSLDGTLPHHVNLLGGGSPARSGLCLIEIVSRFASTVAARSCQMQNFQVINSNPDCHRSRSVEFLSRSR
jgi:hypothetical protein